MTPIIVKYISDKILCLSYNCRGETCEGSKLAYDEFCVNCRCLTPNQEKD